MTDRTRPPTLRSWSRTVAGYVGRPPPALQLPRVGPQLPDVLDRRGVLRGQGEGVRLLVGHHADDGHGSCPPVGRRGLAEAVEPAAPQRLEALELTAGLLHGATSVRTSCSRPRRRLVTS